MQPLKLRVKFRGCIFGWLEGILTASKFIGVVIAVADKIAHFEPADALFVGALELVELVARFAALRAQRHVVLIRAIAAVVSAVAKLVARNAKMVVALEATLCITSKVF